jgi:serine/threonine protein kinase
MSVELSSDQLISSSCSRSAQCATLGPWRLIRILGEGEWARVFLAAPIDATSSSSADYAIKLLKPEFSGDTRWTAILQREAFLGQHLAHPHLACVLSAHVDRSTPYLVLPYQPGQTVRELLTRSIRLPVSQGLWIARQIAEGLTALHDGSWLHGDVKPENSFVSVSGHVTLCDLGFARSFVEGKQNRTVLMGTPAYLAPEFFCDHSTISPGSDVYALGIMLFEMLTGERPFPQQDPAELTAAHRLLPPPDPRRFVPDLSPSLCRLIRQLLAKEPLRRPTGLELVNRLVDLEIDAFETRL